MGHFRSTLNCVLILSGAAAFMFLLEIAIDVIVSYAVGIPTFETGGINIVGLISLSIPFCGWLGARNKDDSLLCLFCGANLGMCVADLCISAFWMVFALAFFAFRHAVSACDPEQNPNYEIECTKEYKQNIYEMCDSVEVNFSHYVANSSQISFNHSTTELFVLLEEEKCIGSIVFISTVLFGFICFLVVLRCCGMCLHATSAYYGISLRALVKDNHSHRLSSGSSSD